MKKILCFLMVAFVSASVCIFGDTEFGVGSGFIFYGDTTSKERAEQLEEPSQIVLTLNAAYRLKLADPVTIAFGAESVLDLYWAGSQYAFLIDYTTLVGFEIYPGLGGFMLSVDYALGRRSDFFNLPGEDRDSVHTKWGNGFKFGIQYDFSYHGPGFAPIIGSSWRRMPRGNSYDNIVSLFFKLTIT